MLCIGLVDHFVTNCAASGASNGLNPLAAKHISEIEDSSGILMLLFLCYA